MLNQTLTWQLTKKDVLPLLEAYCRDCHDTETKKGPFDLENRAPNMLSDEDVPERWRLVEGQEMGYRDQRNYLGVRVVIRKASSATPKKK